jgi:LmbE family N-acetylglucosaminyl deacetylase
MSEPSGAHIVPVGDLRDAVGITSVDIATPSVALAVAAHPDDIEFGCGATLAKWAAAGCRVHHLVLTDGSKGTWSETADVAELVHMRQAEQREAARLLGGGDVTFLGITDGELDSSIATRQRVSEVIRKVKPAVLLGHDPWRRYRLHPDHRNAGWLVTDALVAARDPKFFPGDGAAHRPDHLFLWEADEPNHLEQVSVQQAETKIEALLAHRSQYLSTMGIEDQPREVAGKASDAVSQTEAFRARVHDQLAAHAALAGAAGVTLGEAFHRIDDT